MKYKLLEKETIVNSAIELSILSHKLHKLRYCMRRCDQNSAGIGYKEIFFNFLLIVFCFLRFAYLIFIFQKIFIELLKFRWQSYAYNHHKEVHVIPGKCWDKINQLTIPGQPIRIGKQSEYVIVGQ